MMQTFETLAAFAAAAGTTFSPSAWITIEQPMIDAFAALTGDQQWMHVDGERAARDLPDGKMIAHGALTISLLARMSFGIFDIRSRRRGVNYGYDKLRFVSPVQAGDRIRLHLTLQRAEPVEGGARLTLSYSVEIEGKPKPALVAQHILFIYEKL